MQWMETGKVVNTHGVKGELKIEPWCDSPEFLLQFKQLLIGGTVYRVLASRVHGSMVLAKLEGIDSVQQAQRLKEKPVSIDRTDVALPEGRYFVQDLIGLTVVDQDGARVGTLYDVLSLPAQDVYVVRDEDGEHYIPAVPEFVQSIDLQAGVMSVCLIEGM